MKKAFTLIELLIVVAIIAILAAIAVPNFLEAQTRSKVSRTQADMRTIATALETYAVDYNAYPQCHPYGVARTADDLGLADGVPILERLTTPVAYLSSMSFRDPFTISSRTTRAFADQQAQQFADGQAVQVNPADDAVARYNTYIYQAFSSTGRGQLVVDSFEPVLLKPSAWILHSAGPDGNYNNLGGILALEEDIDGPILLIYDPTNGTVSYGSIFRTGGSSGAGDGYAGGQGLIRAIQSSSK